MQDHSRTASVKVAVGSHSVSVVIAEPAGIDRGTTVVLAHGAGRDMHDPFLSSVHECLAAHGYRSVKFNFPYTERGRRAPDPAATLEACYRAVVAAERAAASPRRLFIGGKSMGGRMASHLAAAGEPVDGLIFLGYPLHPAGKPEQLRDAHLPRISAPMLFFAGSRDPLCRLDLLRPVLARLHSDVTLHVITGGDHSFDLPKALGRGRAEVWSEIVDATDRWLQAHSD